MEPARDNFMINIFSITIKPTKKFPRNFQTHVPPQRKFLENSRPMSHHKEISQKILTCTPTTKKILGKFSPALLPRRKFLENSHLHSHHKENSRKILTCTLNIKICRVKTCLNNSFLIIVLFFFVEFSQLPHFSSTLLSPLTMMISTIVKFVALVGFASMVNANHCRDPSNINNRIGDCKINCLSGTADLSEYVDPGNCPSFENGQTCCGRLNTLPICSPCTSGCDPNFSDPTCILFEEYLEAYYATL